MARFQSIALLCLLAAATTIATAQSSNNSDKVVIKVGDTDITQAQFDLLWGDFRKANQGGPIQKKQTIAENYAGTVMLSKEALAEGLDKDPEIVRQLEMNRLQILSNAAYDRLENQSKPTDQEIKAYYNAHLTDFDEVAIRRLFVYKQTPNSNGHGIPADQAKARADEIRKVLASGGDAKALIANTKDALDVDPITFRRGELPGNMASAFDMKVGEWSAIADSPESLSMFVVTKKDRMPLSQASLIIEKKLQAEKVREGMEALKKKFGVWMDEKYFAAPVSAENGEVASPSEGKQEKD